MATLRTSVTHRASGKQIYGLVGAPRLMSYERKVLTIYRVEVKDSPYLIIDQWLHAKSIDLAGKRAYGESDRYGEIYARVGLSATEYRNLREYMNQRYVGISYPGAGVLMVCSNWDSVLRDKEVTILGQYEYHCGPNGFIFRADGERLFSASLTTNRVRIEYDKYLQWDQSMFNNQDFTGGLGIFESTDQSIESALETVDGDHVTLDLSTHQINNIAENLIHAMRMPGVTGVPQRQTTCARYFITYVP